MTSTPRPKLSCTGAPETFSMRAMSEDDQIAMQIRMFNLDPVLRSPKVISVTGDTHTDFYYRQDPTHELFDHTYPEPIGGRRSGKASRRYWTIEILRWRIREAARSVEGGES